MRCRGKCDWVSAIDTLLFLILFLKHVWVCQGKTWHTLFLFACYLAPRNVSFYLLQPHARGHPEGGGDGGQYGDKDLQNLAPDLFVFVVHGWLVLVDVFFFRHGFHGFHGFHFLVFP